MKQKLHIGSLIKQVAQERKVKPREFAEQLYYCRSNIYDIFKRPSIDFDLLQKISEILDYDFMALHKKNEQDLSIMAVIKTNVAKFDELSADSSLEILMSKQL
ncbi:hypothetical protein FACS189429_2310 [Bacteroidia bacterium]|nr:hypothetical protein FACS189429_2310 [Bacteroidia bacterium]GHV44990.1 hypothetical protein FACS1894180_7020 [Bacteroidia bacterium]